MFVTATAFIYVCMSVTVCHVKQDVRSLAEDWLVRDLVLVLASDLIGVVSVNLLQSSTTFQTIPLFKQLTPC